MVVNPKWALKLKKLVEPTASVQCTESTGLSRTHVFIIMGTHRMGNTFIHPLVRKRYLAKTDATRQKRYTALFEQEIPDYTLEEIRDSINRAWVLGDGRFKQQIEKKTGRRASPNARGGDRRSEKYRARKKNH